MRAFGKTLTSVILGALFLSSAPAASAQKPQPPAKTQSTQPAMAPQQTAPPPGRRVVIVEPIRVFDPFFDYPYPYAYPPDYMASNFGYVKIKTDLKNALVYVDGGFADRI